MAKNLIKRLFWQLKLFPIKAFKGIDGWLTNNEAWGLYTIAQKLPANAIAVEIGSWQGKSTYCIAKGLRNGKIFAIDPFNAGSGVGDEGNIKIYQERKANRDLQSSFLNNMKTLGVSEKIIIKKGFSNEFYADFDQINFLFIDGDHSIEGCKSDYDNYAPKVIKGGFIAFHDYYEENHDLGPTYVIEKVISKNEFSFFARYDSLWVGQKN